MKLRDYHLIIIVLAALLAVTAAIALLEIGSPKTSADRDVLYQVSAMDVLTNGAYDGLATAGDVKGHGDFGVGTFDHLNGEAILLDGALYQVTSDGVVHTAGDPVTMPFAAVTDFEPDMNVSLSGPLNYSTLTAALDGRLPSKNVFYAIRIHGTFPAVKVRSVPAQEKPYPPLSEVVKNQSVFDLENVTGTLVGIYSPAFTGGVESPGYHFHFIADDHKAGGHVLDLNATGADAQLDETAGFRMELPKK